jgi:putative Mn2+ efflux pump MntP
MLKLALFVLPLGLDTFAVATALGLRGLPARERTRISLLMSSFEMAMPVVGLLVGRGLGSAIGSAADYVAVAVLALAGGYMLVAEGEGGEQERLALVSTRDGLALLLLGLSISLDELAMGVSIGLLHLSIAVAVVMIGVQAFLAAQLGLRLGSRLGSAAAEFAETLAGVALLALAVFLLAEKVA